jgi:hypothetical protein
MNRIETSNTKHPFISKQHDTVEDFAAGAGVV